MSSQPKANFNFTKLVVEDLEKSADFYKEVCGIRELGRVDAEIAGRPIREIMFHPTQEAGATLVLLTFVGAPKPAAGELILGFTTPDLAAFVLRVQRAGGSVAEEIKTLEEMKIKVAFVRDLEGHLIEVVQQL